MHALLLIMWDYGKSFRNTQVTDPKMNILKKKKKNEEEEEEEEYSLTVLKRITCLDKGLGKWGGIFIVFVKEIKPLDTHQHCLLLFDLYASIHSLSEFSSGRQNGKKRKSSEKNDENWAVTVKGFLGAADFFRDRKQTRMKWPKYEMQLKMGTATVVGSLTTRRMVPLSGIFSLSPLSKMTVAMPSNLLGKRLFSFFPSFYVFEFAKIIFSFYQFDAVCWFLNIYRCYACNATWMSMCRHTWFQY